MNIVTKAEIKVLELEANDLGLSEDALINRAGLLIASFTHQRLQPHKIRTWKEQEKLELTLLKLSKISNKAT